MTAIGEYATYELFAERVFKSTDRVDDEARGLIDMICDEVNTTVERETHQVFVPFGTHEAPETVYLDGNDRRRLIVPWRIRFIDSIEVALITGASYTVLLPQQWVLRPNFMSLKPGWPYDSVELVDVYNYNTAFDVWPVGYNTIKLVGGFRWEEAPSDIIKLALDIGIRYWKWRQQGWQDHIGGGNEATVMGLIISNTLTPEDKAIMESYKIQIADDFLA